MSILTKERMFSEKSKSDKGILLTIAEKFYINRFPDEENIESRKNEFIKILLEIEQSQQSEDKSES
ncbi:MAG: hypothetical protein IID16_12035 [Candidatus Marinimicrobia bacterium]|nr:hypothetical protein [Candidatus Neomarinimicrobiota bacterium]